MNGGHPRDPAGSTEDAGFDTDFTLSTLLSAAPAQAAPRRGRFGAPEQVIADRYTLVELIGQGGMGEVWRAIDRIGDGPVAVKLVPALAASEQEQVRRELAALRWLRLPGVVQLLDDGRIGDLGFLVMELIEGKPFLDTRSRWEEVAPAVRELLENLARVHFAGVVHRDLKPANVRLDRAGHPILLDFGIARGSALAGGTVGVEGTPFTMAPEVLSGQPCDGRADLYALGVMLYYALSGRMPHGGSKDDIVHAERVPLKAYAPGVPAEVRHVIDALLAIDPDERPATALEVLERLGGHPPPTFTPPEDAADPSALRPLFHGEDGFLHVQEDAATVLWERTGGDRERVGRELAAWMRSGLAYWLGELVSIDRPAVERLRVGLRLGSPPDLSGLGSDAREVYRQAQLAWPDGPVLAGPGWDELAARRLVWPLPDGRAGVDPYVRPADDAADHLRMAETLGRGEPRLRHLIAGSADPVHVATEAREAARQLREVGKLARATAIAALGLAASREIDDSRHQEGPLTELVLGLLAQNFGAATNRARYELERTLSSNALLESHKHLVQAFASLRTAELGRAAEHLGRLGPFVDPELEAQRQNARVLAVSHADDAVHEALLEEIREWAVARPDAGLHRYTNHLGNLRYRQGRYRDAAALYAEAAKADHAGAATRLIATVNEAGAWLDALDLDRALSVAIGAKERARALRLPDHEARATYVERAARYRLQQDCRARPDLVDAARALGSRYHEGLIALQEAAFAWRSGDLSQATELASRSRDAQWGGAGVRALTEALIAACHAEVSESQAEQLDRLAQQCGSAEIAAQVYGLLCRAGPPPTHAAWRARARQLPITRTAAERSVRLDILSIDECLEES